MSKKTQRKNKNKQLPGTDLIIYTDGGCDHNPGGHGAYGIVLYHQGSGNVETFSRAFESTTNNRMELLAVIVALEKVHTNEPIVLYSDSKYVVNTLNGEYSRNANSDLWERYDEAIKNKHILYIWIPGHSGHRYNELCDQLCSKAMENGPYYKDEGYIRIQNEKTKRESVLTVDPALTAIARQNYQIPPQYEEKPVASSCSEYSEKYAVHMSCAKQIMYFYQYGFHGAKHYVGLKSGGSDYWSNIRDKEMRMIIGEEQLTIISRYLPDAADQIKAGKWHCRGLTLSDAIKKAMIEKELYSK